MNITQLVLMPTGTYDTMVVRPYEVVDNIRGLAKLQDVTRYGQNLTPEAISGVSGSILRPSASHLGQARIENGWGQRRCRFIMHIETQDMDGSSIEQYLTGFTDYDGVNTNTGTVDLNMRFYVNNSITMRNIRVLNSFGYSAGAGIAKADQVFTRPGRMSLTTDVRNAECLQRPKDVFTTLQTSEYLRDADMTFDPRSMFLMENIKLSGRGNTLAPKYMSSILKAGASSFMSSDFTDSQAKLWGSAEGLAGENSYGQDTALFELHRKTSFHEGESFTYGELNNICPHLDHVTLITKPQEMSRGETSSPTIPEYRQGMYDGWNGQNHETVWATVLSSSVPTLMMECMLANVGFRAHNHTLNGETLVDFYYAQPFGKNLDGVTLSENFRTRLIMFVLRDLVGDNPASFDIQGHFDILGESSLHISINGGVSIPFATPTFADALFSPVLTHGQDRLKEVANHMAYFTEHLVNTDATAIARVRQQNSPSAMTSSMGLGAPLTTQKSWLSL